MQLFGQNMLFMEKVLNSETKKVADHHHSELMPEVTLANIKDFSHCFLAIGNAKTNVAETFQSR